MANGRTSVTHITLRRGAVYYYRRRLPRPHRGCIALSLRTSHYREAEYLGRLLDQRFITFFKGTVPVADIQAILRDYLRKGLEEDRQQHLDSPPGRAVYALMLNRFEDPFAADLEAVESLLHDFEVHKRQRDLSIVHDDLTELMAFHDVPEALRVELGLGLLQANIQMLEQARENLRGGVVAKIAVEPPSKTPPPPTASGGGSSPLFSSELPKYIRYAVDRKGWKPHTRSQNELTFRLFVEVCGDLPVQDYKRVNLGLFYDALSMLPPLYGKAPRWRGMTVLEIVDDSSEDDTKRLAMKTVSRHMSALGGFFTNLKSRGKYEGENPAHGFDYPDQRDPADLRQMWEGEQLVALLESPIWTGCKSKSSRHLSGNLIIEDSKYWLPVLGLYHGNRLEEFAQLRREDVTQIDGVWVFRITDAGDRQLKNKYARRLVPLHPRVHDLGFLRFVEDVARGPEDPLFPELVPGGSDIKFGHAFSKWWTRYRRLIGLYEVGLDYHSFRHGVTTKLYNAGVQESVIDELTGHGGGGTSRRTYKKGALPVEMLREAVCKIEWPEDRIKAPSRLSK